MDYQNIKKLLEKYWEGNSSLEEEALLKSYFQQDTIAPELECYQPLFQYLTEEEAVSTTLNSKDLAPKGWSVHLWTWKRWTTVAASVVILVLASLWFYPKVDVQTTSSYTVQDTYTNPQEAYNEVKSALLLISTKINKGVETTKKELKNLRE